MEETAPVSSEPAAEPGTEPAVQRAPIVVVQCVFAETDDIEAHLRHARHVDGVERIAAALGTVDPVVWEGDRAWLSCAGGRREQHVSLAWRAAVELWQRGAIDLDLPVRIAVMFCPVGGDGLPITGGASAPEIAALVGRAPERAIVASEDLALCLRPEHRREIAPGGALDDGSSVYVFPADTVKREPGDHDEHLLLWSAFEEYALSSKIRGLHYVGFRLPRRAPPVLELTEVFVPPTAVPWREVLENPRHLEIEHFRTRRQSEGGAPPVEPALEWSTPREPVHGTWSEVMPAFGSPIEILLARHAHLVVLGEPGAGKTTLLKWLAIVAAEGSWPALTGEPGPRLPLLLSVGRLAEALADDTLPRTTALAAYFGVTDRDVAAQVARFLDRQLERGRCVVLLDGLDEVRAADRARTEAWLQDFATHYPANRFVATSRFVGYSGLRLPEDAAVVRLSPLGPRGRERFVRAFCNAYLKWETGEERRAEADVQATALLQAILASDRLSALAQNPFMLSALALIHRAEGRLPRHRIQAYQMFLRALCETWSEARKLVPDTTPKAGESTLVAYEEEAIPVLGELALEMHQSHPRGVAPVEVVRGAIARVLRTREEMDEASALAAADRFLKRAGDEVQILLERGAGQWGFLHLTFQELFVAAGLHANERFEEIATLHLLEPRWEEVIRLGVGYLALIQARPVAAQKFVERVLDHEAPEPFRRAAKILGKHIGLAAQLAVEAGEALPPRTQRRIAEAFTSWICDGCPRDVADSIHGRAHLGRVSQWLRQIALSEIAKPFVDGFIGRLRTGDARGRIHAVNALEEMEARIPPAVLVDILLGDSTVDPARLGRLLAQSTSPEELLTLSRHSDERVRAATARAAELRPAAERAALLEALVGDPSPLVRELSAQLPLSGPGGFYGSEEMTAEEEAFLLRPLLADPHPDVRSAAAYALLNQQLRVSIDAVTPLLEDTNIGVVSAAAQVLARAGDEGMRVLVEHAEKPAARVALWQWAEARQWTF